MALVGQGAFPNGVAQRAAESQPCQLNLRINIRVRAGADNGAHQRAGVSNGPAVCLRF